MAKIIKIKDNIVSIGNDNGKLIEIMVEDCNFNPEIGDEVSIFSSDTKTICVKNDYNKNSETDTQSSTKNNGVNINIAQNQNSNNYDDYCATNSKKVVNKVLYVILAVFFGGIGIHKFYSGKTTKGIIYILFSWTGIPTIIGTIEGICACFKKEDSNGRILI